ncbi:glycosyltransferase family 9 protein [Thermodesulfobacteriota bacterium]
MPGIKIMNILIVKLSAIGDVVHTLPALNAIRKQHPEAHITWLVEEAAHDVIKGHKALDRIIVSKRKDWINGLLGGSAPMNIREMRFFLKELRDTHYDLIIDFQALLKSAVLIGLARGTCKTGFDKGMEHMEYSYLLLNHRIAPVDMEIHALRRGLMLLKSLGITTEHIEYDFPISEKDRHRANHLLENQGIKTSDRFMTINPVAKWETKNWSNHKFAQLADKLKQQLHIAPVFTGSPGDRRVIEDIIGRMENNAVNLAGRTTLKTLAALYERAEFVVSTDTGPAHIAAAVGARVVAIFGPTAPWRTGPYGPHHQIIRADLTCSPCFKRECHTKACMMQIGVADVLKGIKMLGE